MTPDRLTPYLALALAASLAAPAAAQRLRDRDLPANHPANDPYTRGGDPELLEAAGYANLGGFEFGEDGWDTERVSQHLVYLQLHWIETEHFQIGSALPRYKVPSDERKKLRAELTELQSKLPDVEPKTRYLDPWLRTHLFAQRAEAAYDEFLAFLGIEESVFPDGTEPWDMTSKYWGEGPYLGMKGKFEILLLPSEGASRDFLRTSYGLTTKKPQRWHVVSRSTLQYVVHTDEGRLRVDEALHADLVFNLTHQFIDAYKHYSYETPIWLHEGMAHWFQRRVTPRYNTFDSSEGAVADMTKKEDWEPPTFQLVRSDDTPRLASMVHMKAYAELELDHHFATWSMVDFLVREHPDFLPAFLDRIKGLKDEQGLPDGSRLRDAQRDAFRDLLGMTYARFDSAWRTWVTENYSSQ